MIVIGLVMIWIALTAAGFAALSLLGRAAAREQARAGHSPSTSQARVRADARVPIPKALLG